MGVTGRTVISDHLYGMSFTEYSTFYRTGKLDLAFESIPQRSSMYNRILLHLTGHLREPQR
jgi:hypothetical protein